MLQLRDPNREFRVTSMGQLAQGGRWKTAAARSHARASLLWFTRGQGRISIAGVTRGFNAHNAIFLPPDTMHGFEMFGPVQGSQILFPEDMAQDLPDDPLHLRVLDGYLQVELTGLVDSLQREATGDRPGAGRAMRHLGGLIGIWLERHPDLADPADAADRASRRIVRAFAALLERDFRTGAGVSDYATRLGVTPTHLTRVCRDCAGQSASALIAERIHGEARRLLSETDLPIKDVARRLGFSSPAYFSRAFQSHAGSSPTDFRRTTAG